MFIELLQYAESSVTSFLVTIAIMFTIGFSISRVIHIDITLEYDIKRRIGNLLHSNTLLNDDYDTNNDEEE